MQVFKTTKKEAEASFFIRYGQAPVMGDIRERLARGCVRVLYNKIIAMSMGFAVSELNQMQTILKKYG